VKWHHESDKLAAQFIVKRFRKLLAESREEWRGKRAKAG
jgi:hypothetical protein